MRAGGIRPSSSCWWVSARRWGWPRCIPGSLTPTARRPALWARFLPAALSTAHSWRCCGSTRYPSHPPGTLLPSRERSWAWGLISMAFAAVFMARQNDLKRMLAYSSVEHVGILTVALGLGSKGALFGALLHMVNNGLTKGVLFLASGNIHRAYNSKSTEVIRGALRRIPWSGALFLVAFLAITGSPPFGPFISEFTIVSNAFLQGNTNGRHPLPGISVHHLHRHGIHRIAGRPGQDTGRHRTRPDTKIQLWTVLPLLVLMGYNPDAGVVDTAPVPAAPA